MQVLALTLGEPAGIGPDLALAIWRRRAELDLPPFYIVADPEFLRRRAAKLGLDVPIIGATAQSAAATFRSALPVLPLDIAVTAEPGQPDRSS
ncbi:MAG: 4-hydroxythreonine-4-phosphate dehydrogenase, partial [Xanthobacteraceae bacterium]